MEPSLIRQCPSDLFIFRNRLLTSLINSSVITDSILTIPLSSLCLNLFLDLTLRFEISSITPGTVDFKASPMAYYGMVRFSRPLIHKEFLCLYGHTTHRFLEILMYPSREISSFKFNILPYIQMPVKKIIALAVHL